MADVQVKQPHNLSVDDAKAKMSDFEDMMKKYGVSATWSGGHADLKGTGVKGAIDVTGSDVNVQLKLGMLAKAAGIDPSRLQNSIARRLKDAFDAA